MPFRAVHSPKSLLQGGSQRVLSPHLASSLQRHGGLISHKLFQVLQDCRHFAGGNLFLNSLQDVCARCCDKQKVWFMQAYRNTVPVPRHWSQKRKYLQGKRGLEKPPFQLPEFIEATGIGEMRQAYQEKVCLPHTFFMHGTKNVLQICGPSATCHFHLSLATHGFSAFF